MNPLFVAALEIQRFCAARGWRFCVIGGVAVQRWGEPRFTRDVDCTIVTAAGDEARYIDELLKGFAPRIPEARDFALVNRVLLLLSAAGVPIDLALGALPFEERVVERASPYAIGPGVTLATCSAEDLVVLKAFAGRDRDWADVEGVVLRQGPRLDRALIRGELSALAALTDEGADAVARLEKMFAGR